MKNQAGIRAAAPLIYDAAMGVDGQTLPPDPIQEEPTYEGALAAFEALDPIRILFDNGAGGDPGKPNPGFEHSFSSFPVPARPRARGTSADDGALQDEPAGQRGRRLVQVEREVQAAHELTEGASTAAGDDGLWTARTGLQLGAERPRATAPSYVTEPLERGHDGHRLRRRARLGPVVEADRRPQATITEVRPDGKETFVQNGWVRGEMRKLDQQKSTLLRPVLSLRARDVNADAARPLREGRRSRSTTRGTPTGPTRRSA